MIAAAITQHSLGSMNGVLSLRSSVGGYGRGSAAANRNNGPKVSDAAPTRSLEGLDSVAIHAVAIQGDTSEVCFHRSACPV